MREGSFKKDPPKSRLPPGTIKRNVFLFGKIGTKITQQNKDLDKHVNRLKQVVGETERKTQKTFQVVKKIEVAECNNKNGENFKDKQDQVVGQSESQSSTNVVIRKSDEKKQSLSEQKKSEKEAPSVSESCGALENVDNSSDIQRGVMESPEEKKTYKQSTKPRKMKKTNKPTRPTRRVMLEVARKRWDYLQRMNMLPSRRFKRKVKPMLANTVPYYLYSPGMTMGKLELEIENDLYSQRKTTLDDVDFVDSELLDSDQSSEDVQFIA
ncbi:hypothetical protein EIN_253300 [Entamoeba invadens IP1]|uniref:Uncharacterized protein n=1 Tax=Entamoeba invadens IP1 TaxID=370355 RepID=A0A0A1UEQ4_ENTIV|nr:hypothetical protein EIN_253300 [Entamoeba invadens IP1]ELP95066.1 hypothetical protein EIN_253300 [Entamoeba invadens IP1]|eukprot:XP_004261837.1 hypothetical protein EIN_253300 [Entamoeba invadens IP1]